MKIIIPPSLHCPHLFVAETPEHGRGVFAAHPIAAGDTIEVCPVLIVPRSQRPALDTTTLYDYYFLWDDIQQDAAIALGYGSLYNHSYQPNAQYVSHVEQRLLEFIAIGDIAQGEEILVNYNGNSEDETQVWFERKIEKNTNEQQKK